MKGPEPARNQPVWLKSGNRLARTRMLRRVKSTFYIRALREGERHLTPPPGEAVEIQWVDGNYFYGLPGLVEEILEPIPIVLIRQTGDGRLIERRGAPRAKVLIPLEYTMARPGSEVHTTTTLDLSWEGLRFPSAFQPWLGLELRMELRIAGETVPVVGRVVRVAAEPHEVRGRQGWETGVQFINLAPAARVRIRALVERVLARGEVRERKGGGAG